MSFISLCVVSVWSRFSLCSVLVLSSKAAGRKGEPRERCFPFSPPARHVDALICMKCTSWIINLSRCDRVSGEVHCRTFVMG